MIHLEMPPFSELFPDFTRLCDMDLTEVSDEELLYGDVGKLLRKIFPYTTLENISNIWRPDISLKARRIYGLNQRRLTLMKEKTNDYLLD
jgi:hypothetical protein